MVWFESLTVVDYLILGLLLLALATGWIRGFVELLTGFVSFLVGTMVAGWYSNQVVGWLNRTRGATEWLSGVLERRMNLPAEAHRVPANVIPWEKASEWLQGVPIPEEYRQTLAKRLVEWSASAGGKSAAAFIIDQLAAGVLSAVTFFVLTLAIGWLLALLGRLISNQVKEIPLVGTTNRLLGSLVAVGEAILGVALVVGLLVPVLSMYGMSSFGSAVDKAQLTPHFLAFFQWLRAAVFGLASDHFFAA